MPKEKKSRKQSTSDSDSGPDDVSISSIPACSQHNLTFFFISCHAENTSEEIT